MDKSTQFPESSLTREEWQELDQTVFESVKKQLVGRRFIDIYGPLGEGVQSVTNDIYETSERGAISFHGEDSGLSVPSRRITLTIPLLYKDFILYWRDIQQAKTLAVRLISQLQQMLHSSVHCLKMNLIFNGSKEFDIQGIMNVKGKLSHIRSDWMESGNAFSDVVEARNKLLRMGHTGPYALVCLLNCMHSYTVFIKGRTYWRLSIFGN